MEYPMAEEPQAPSNDELADALDLSQEELARIKDMREGDYDEFLDLVEEDAGDSQELGEEDMADVAGGGGTIMDGLIKKKNSAPKWNMTHKELDILVYKTMGNNGTLESVLEKCGCEQERNYARKHWNDIYSPARRYTGETCVELTPCNIYFCPLFGIHVD